jgi:phosphotransacetylase
MAKDLMEDGSYFGTMMVYKGHADGMVSGAAHTTQHTILPALQFIKTKPNSSVVSSIFLCARRPSFCFVVQIQILQTWRKLPFPLLTLVWPLG